MRGIHIQFSISKEFNVNLSWNGLSLLQSN